MVYNYIAIFLFLRTHTNNENYSIIFISLDFAAYLSTAVEPSVKTEYTAKLGTSAVLGTVMGPSVGALTSQILGQNDITIHGLPLDANNVPAFLILVGTITIFVQVSYDLI